MPTALRPISGIKVLGAPICHDAYVAIFLRERISSVGDLLSAFEAMNNLHISTKINLFCASVAQVVHVFRDTPLEQTAPMLRDFNERQLM